MAPKRKKKKEYKPKVAGGTSPLVVIFLVLFMLISIGLGVACYYGYAGQAELEKKAKDAATAKTVADKNKDLADYIAREWKDAIGNPLLSDTALDEQAGLKVGREDFKNNRLGDKSPVAPLIKAGIDENKKILGWDEAGQKYQTNFKAKVKALEDDVDKWKSAQAKSAEDFARAEKNYNDLKTFYKDEYDKIKDDIAKGNKKALDELDKKITKMDELVEINKKQGVQIDTLKSEHAGAIREKDKLVAELYAELEKMKEKYVMAKPKPGGGGPQPQAGQQHALLLDVSKGRPLWDEPKGKLNKVDVGKREVIINLGRADGVEEEMTFNVFGAGWKGEASGPLKGTIEIKKVLDAGTSVGQITALFDLGGKEISLYDPLKGAAQRAAENPMKEGDLIFNVFWKARVALAGKFNFSGYSSPSAAEDLRQMKLFINLLQKQGMQVDAYIDLTTGKIMGEMTQETRFLILGDKATKELGMIGKVPDPELFQRINDNMDLMKKQAIERGLFVISAYNFAFISGYRPPQSADSTKVSLFSATLPSAGGGFKTGEEGKKDEKGPMDPPPEKKMEK